MTAAQQLKEIKGILNIALAPTLRFEGRGRKMTEIPMTQVERVKWLADELRDKNNELQAIADEAAGEDL
jgi:hypothetical protein